MELQRLQSLIPLLGAEFIAYASNTTADSINSMLTGDTITPQVNQAIIELRTLIDAQMPLSAEKPEGGVMDVRAHLDMLNLSMLMGLQFQGNSIGNAVRLIVGGTLPSINITDTLETELAKLARDVYPILLLPLDDNDHLPDYMNISSIITPAIIRNVYSTFFDAIEADTTLGNLYAEKGSSNGQDRYLKSFNYWLNTGNGPSQQLLLLPTELIIPAHYKNQIEDRATPEEFIEQVIENLRLFKQLANNKTVEVPAYVAINGVTVPDNVELILPWGTLRKPTGTELALLSPRSQMINAVLVVPFELKMKKLRNFAGANYPFLNDKARENVEEAAMLTSAAIMVSLGKEVRTESVGTIILPNFGHSPSTSWAFEKPGGATRNLSAKDRSKVTRISSSIETYKKHLNIALRRNLMAINRLDTLDGFIDSIIAMESLFGSDRETTFTVSSAMAKFLKTSPDERLALKKEIAKLYHERSRIIHGASFPTPTNIEAKRQRVIDLNIEVMRKLLYRRKDLIDCTSSERSTKILLS